MFAPTYIKYTTEECKQIGIHSGWYKRESGLKHGAVQRSARSCFNRKSTAFSKHPTG
jgi:hypothetical protein